MVKRILVVCAAALAVVPFTAGVASATNVTEKVECMFRVYVNEGGEQGLDCLV